MNKPTTLEYNGTLIPITYFRGKACLQVKSVSSAVGVTLSGVPAATKIGNFSYAYYCDVIEKLRKVAKKNAQQTSYELAVILEDKFSKQQIAQIGSVTELKVNVQVSSDAEVRQAEREAISKYMALMKKRLTILDLTDQIEAGDYE